MRIRSYLNAVLRLINNKLLLLLLLVNEYLWERSAKRCYFRPRSIARRNEWFIICCQTKLDDVAYEQTIICMQLFACQVVGCRPMKRKKNLHRMTMVVAFLLLLRKCYRDMSVACVYNDNVLHALLFGRVKRVSRAAKPRGAPRSRVLARLASLAQIGELARRLNGVEQSRYTSETRLLSHIHCVLLDI